MRSSLIAVVVPIVATVLGTGCGSELSPAESDLRQARGIFWPNLYVGSDLTKARGPEAPWAHFADIHLRISLANRGQAEVLENHLRRGEWDRVKTLLLDRLAADSSTNIPANRALVNALPDRQPAVEEQGPGIFGIFWPNLLVGTDLSASRAADGGHEYFAEIHLRIGLGRDDPEVGRRNAAEVKRLEGGANGVGLRDLLKARLDSTDALNEATRAIVDSFRIRPKE